MRKPKVSTSHSEVESSQSARLAILDWGVGGLGVATRLLRKYPALSLVYFSDSGCTPYGKLPRGELAARLSSVARMLTARRVTHLAIACNAASTAFPGYDALELKHELDVAGYTLQVSGIVAHALGAIDAPDRLLAGQRGPRARALSSVGVIGGARTIRAQIYRRELMRRGHTVIQRIAQPLSAFVEAGDLSSPNVTATISRIVQPLAHCDALLLACTHYPALSPLLQARLPHVPLIDPANDMARWIERNWQVSLKQSAAGPDFLTTGTPGALKRAAKLAFGIEIANVERVHMST